MGKRNVTLLPSGQTFMVEPNELVLDAAIRQGISVPYSCRNGTCRTCLFEVKEGSLQAVDPELCMLTEQELSANRRLLCMSLCSVDAVVERPQRRKKPAETDAEATSG